MKIISTSADGTALVQFENLIRYTDVVGITAPIQAKVSIASIPSMLRIQQQGRRAAQKLQSLFLKTLNEDVDVVCVSRKF